MKRENLDFKHTSNDNTNSNNILLRNNDENNTQGDSTLEMNKKLRKSNKIFLNFSEKLVNKRRKKNELNSEKYICSQCKRIYYSYAALYVHIRRKHNLTLQEIKENFFNEIDSEIIEDVTNPYYNFIENFRNSFSKIYKKVCSYDFLNEKFKKNTYEENPLFLNVLKIYSYFLKSLTRQNFLLNLIMTLDDSLAVYLIYQWGNLQKQEMEKTIELSLIFWIFSNSCGFDLLFINDDSYKKNISIFCFSENTLEKINFNQIFPELCENFFFILGGRLTDIDLEETLSFVFEFNKFMMYESLVNFVLEPHFEN